MPTKKIKNTQPFHRFALCVLALAFFIVVNGFSIIRPPKAQASTQLTSRKVTIDKSNVSSTSVQYVFSFVIPTAGSTDYIQSIRIRFCDSPVSTCNKPTGFDASSYTISGNTFTATTAFTAQATNLGDCTVATSTNNTFEVCVKRTAATTDESDGATKTLTLAGFVNGSTANSTVYTRMDLYSDNSFTNANLTYYGVMAAAFTQRLTIQARVQETLSFCVGTTTVNDATTTPGASCSNISGSTVDIGIVDTTTTGAVSPDSDGSNTNGVAMLDTNASGGATVGYKSVQQSGSNHLGTLRVASASCNAGDVNTDQCFKAFSTETAPVASTEQFGMTVRFVNYGSQSVADNTPDLTRTADYDFGSSGYAWDESGSLASVATSSGPVDGDALILKFLAVANTLTPTGTYTAQADFIATPTY